MRCHISLDVILNSIPIEEGVEYLDKVLRLLEVILHSDEVLDARPRVLQDAVQMGQAIPDELVVTLHVGDHVEETANCGLGLFLVLTTQVRR
jgi:hypothetical protein